MSTVLPSNTAASYQTFTGNRKIVRKFTTLNAPVGMWNFEDDLTDDSGAGLDLTAAGTVIYYERYGLTWAQTAGLMSEETQAASLRILGDMSVHFLVDIPNFSLTNFFRYMHHGGDPASQLEAQNAIYNMAIGPNGEMTTFHEYGGGTNQPFTATSLRMPDGPHLLTLTRVSNVLQFYLDGAAWGAPSGTLTAPTGGASGKLRFVNDDATSNDCFFGGVKIVSAAQNAAAVLAEWEDITELNAIDDPS